MTTVDDQPGGVAHGSAAAPGVDEAEVYFLLAHALSNGPFAHLGQALASEAAAQGLLPCRHDVSGGTHVLTYGQLRGRYAHLPPSALRQALGGVLQHTRQAAAHPAARGFTSLLDSAVLGGLLRAEAAAAAPPRWLLPPASNRNGGQGLPPPQLLLLREVGAAARSPGAELALPPSSFARLLHHHQTIRGHRFVAYCIVYDKAGRHVITGADDRLVKIWSVTTGLLRCTCRGHSGEVSDLSVNADDSLVASGALDASVRVWQLRGKAQLGFPVAVLLGHAGIISGVNFHPTLPNVLLSAGMDGTCRIWNARDSTQPPLVLQLSGPSFGGAPPAAVATRAAGGSGELRIRLRLRHAERQHGEGGMGQADPTQGQQQQQQQQEEGVEEQAARRARLRSGGAEQAERPQQPAENGGAVAGGAGHEHDEDEEEEDEAGQGPAAVTVSAFSRDGTHIVAGSSDCSAYVWQWPAPPAPPADLGGEQRQLAEPALPPPPGTAWPPALEVCRLEGHRNNVYLLQHSNGGRLLATGSKDGSVRIWRRPRRARRRAGASWEVEATIACPPDEAEVKLARQRRRPAPTQRVDQIVWACDDSRLAVTVHDCTVRVFEAPSGRPLNVLKGHSDVVHVLLAHPSRPEVAVSAGYDGKAIVWDTGKGLALATFDSRQTRPGGLSWPDPLPFVDGFMAPSGNGFALTDAAGQLHLYGVGPRCSLTARAPYDQFLTTDFDQLIHDAEGNVLVADTQTPAHVLTGREAMCDIMGQPYPLPFQQAYRSARLLAVPARDAACEEAGRQASHMQAAPTLTAAVWRLTITGGGEVAMQNAAHRAQVRLVEHDELQEQLQVDGGAAGGRAGAGEEGRRAGPRRAGRQVEWRLVEEEEEEEAESEESEEEGDAQARALRHSERLAGRQPERPPRWGAPSWEQRQQQQRQEREERAARRLQAHERGLEQQRQRRRQRASLSHPSRHDQPGDFEHDEYEAEEFTGGEEEEEEEDDYSVSLVDDSEEEGSEREGGSDGGHRRRASRPERRERKRQRTDPGPQRPRPSVAGRAARPTDCYAWLSSAESLPGSYVPQLGDSVVYVREGHAALLAQTNDTRRPPWQALPRGRSMRPAEPCTVVALLYAISEDGLDDTVGRVTLQLNDPASPLQGQSFSVDLHNPSAGLPEFVVHRARFDAGIAAAFSVDSPVQAFWHAVDGGKWWAGKIASDRRPAGPAGVAADPFGCGGLWDRFSVRWDGALGADGELELRSSQDEEEGAVEESDHSQWEFYAADATVAAARAEMPSLDPDMAQRAERAVEAAAAEERWAIFQAAPEWDEAYRSLAGRSEHYNRRVALPLALMDISSRLHLGYYRQQAALEHDVCTIADNAKTFNGADSPTAADARAMAAYLLAVIGGDEGADIQAGRPIILRIPMRNSQEAAGAESDGDPLGLHD